MEMKNTFCAKSWMIELLYQTYFIQRCMWSFINRQQVCHLKRKNEVSPTLPHSGKITHLIVHTFPLLEVPEITQCH